MSSSVSVAIDKISGKVVKRRSFFNEDGSIMNNE
jgi:hypothetical protein